MADIDPASAAALMAEIAHDARHARRMAWARLVAAILVFGASLALSAYFVGTGISVGGMVSVGSGTLAVVTILLTGSFPRQRI
ncbi:hypothetical protein [Catenuloplanes atrovinosus]|uniref:Tetrahydromethanopterin S-methyltransferase subunit C n=1 Tax=Catenuloplanes atrovinosus TaxID=137266 RepID=A0AAE3YN27_9ACTN|nr:hypothetical protein [Catenuloplanes atrovinosus]MDR7275537.1 tetrahydromethanopterin S-methyltransferase subunit C [Catenuloplanes atrovinosus]